MGAAVRVGKELVSGGVVEINCSRVSRDGAWTRMVEKTYQSDYGLFCVDRSVTPDGPPPHWTWDNGGNNNKIRAKEKQIPFGDDNKKDNG